MAVMYLDESEQGDFLAVGGFYCHDRDVPPVESAWADMKVGMGLDPAQPMKWSPQGIPQQQLKGTIGIDEARRRAASVITGLPLEIVVVVLQERRGSYVVLGPSSTGVVEADIAEWKEIYPQGGGVRHFYLRGVEFTLQRFADHLGLLAPESRGPSHLVLDDLQWASSPGKMTKKLKAQLDSMPGTDSWVIRDWIETGLQALCAAYARWHRTGFAQPYARLGSLGALGCESSFHECHGDWSDAMQIADFVAGTTGAFVSEVARGKLGIARDCVRALRSRFRATGTIGYGMWGNGFVLWPPNADLWNKAKGALV